jgi:hypothetical protein
LVALLAVGVTVAGASITTPTDAAPTRTMGGVRFVLRFQGSFEGSWRITEKRNDISGYKCGGYENWGTFKSTVRPGSRPLTAVAATDLGGRSVFLDWGRSSAPFKGVVNSARTGEGWSLDYQKGACVQVPTTWEFANCKPRTFAGLVGLEKDSKLTRGVQRVFLNWELEPENASVGCLGGQMWGAVGVPGEEARATLDLRKLYRCGIQKPRACRLTIRGSHSHSHSIAKPTPDGTHTDVGNGRIDWSVTFVAVGRVA